MCTEVEVGPTNPDRYAVELAYTTLWACDENCERKVKWFGDWYRQPVVFKRTNVRGNGDCVFEASSNPGERVVTRASLVNWLTEQHRIYNPENEGSLQRHAPVG